MRAVLAGLALLVVWIVLAFVVVWPSGWAHVPLAAGVILIAAGIVKADERRARGGSG